MEFRTAYNTHSTEAEATPSGEKVVYEHREEIDTKGKRRLIQDRAVNIYEKIQASAESTEIETILRRAAEGDTSILNMVNGNYLDVTGAPSSLAEAQQFVIRAKNEFNNLPKEVRAKFENNAEVYVANYGTQLWEDAIGITEAKEIQKKQKETEVNFKKMQETAFKTIIEKGAVTNE